MKSVWIRRASKVFSRRERRVFEWDDRMSKLGHERRAIKMAPD